MAGLGLFALLYVISLFLYLSNKTAMPSIDTIPARYLSLSLLRDGDLNLDEYREQKKEFGIQAAREYNGHLLSDFPIGAAFFGAPYYALGQLAGLQPEGAGMIWLEKWAAANTMALASALFWFMLRKTRASFPARLIVWLVFAFGSSNWVPCSQGLWQHGPAEFFAILALLAWPDADGKWRRGYLTLSGIFLGLSVMMRPTMAVLLPVWLVVSFYKDRKGSLYFLMGAVIGLLPLLWYQLHYFGSLVGGYFLLIKQGQYFTRFRPLYFLAAHLFAPSRGLFVFTPFFILAPLSFLRRLRPFRPRIYHGYLWGFSALALGCVVISYRKWWSGYGYGPRYWSDLLPFLCLVSLPAVEWLRKHWWGILVVGILGVWSIMVQGLGAWRYDGGWDDAVKVDKNPQACWNLHDNTIFFCITGGVSHRKMKDSIESYTLPPGGLETGKPENSHFFHSGFFPQEPWGIWSRAHYPAIILFHIPEKKEGKLLFILAASSVQTSPKILRFKINGRFIGDYRFKNDSMEQRKTELCVVDVPAQYLTGGLEKLKITCSEGTFLGPGFSRFFGFALYKFGWVSNETFEQIRQQLENPPPK